jgi:hypothetical protein
MYKNYIVYGDCVQIKALWKETQREVRQHWFIYSYISAYIQALYMYCLGLLEYIR